MFQCPKCHDKEDAAFYVEKWITVDGAGDEIFTGDESDSEEIREGGMECVSCGYVGTVPEFRLQ